LLGADHVENNFPYLVACWELFTEPLPGNALIKSVTICHISIKYYGNEEIYALVTFLGKRNLIPILMQHSMHLLSKPAIRRVLEQVREGRSSNW
jgi:hypothetical protein